MFVLGVGWFAREYEYSTFVKSLLRFSSGSVAAVYREVSDRGPGDYSLRQWQGLLRRCGRSSHSRLACGACITD